MPGTLETAGKTGGQAGPTVLGLWLLGVAIGAVGPVAWAQRLGMLPVLVLAVAAMLVAYRPHPGRVFRNAAILMVAGGCAWIAISLAWAPRIQPDRVGALIGTLLLCGLAVALSRPPPAPHDQRLRAVFVLSVVFLVAALAFEAATSGAGSALIRGVESVGRAVWPRGSAILVVMVWIALAILVERRWFVPALILAAAAGYAIWGGTMRSGQVASVTGLAAFAAAALAPRLVPLLSAALFGLYALAAPWISLHFATADAGFRWISSLPLSAYHRLAIWEQAAAQILENPISGMGFGAARWISDQHERIGLAADARVRVEVMPLHTHNGWLQLWLELGLVGLLFAIAIVVLAAAGARRRYVERPALMAVSGAMTAGMTVASLSFGIWQEWWLATLALTAVLTMTLFPGSARNRS